MLDNKNAAFFPTPLEPPAVLSFLSETPEDFVSAKNLLLALLFGLSIPVSPVVLLSLILKHLIVFFAILREFFYTLHNN